MKRIILALTMFCSAACSSSTPPAQNPSQETAAAETNEANEPAAVAPDDQKALEHLRHHIKYPATRSEILAACANTQEFSPGEKEWFEHNLPEGTYNSPEEVGKALGIPAQ